MSAEAERPREDWTTCRGGVESMGTSRLEAVPHRRWPKKDNIDLTPTILQVGVSCERKRRV